jgi:epoxyqueuosine reductase
MKNKTDLSNWIRQQAQELGFMACGIARADFLSKEAPVFENWLRQGMHGRMSYMENHFDKRLDPRKLMEGAKSVIIFLHNYFPEKELPEKDNYILSKYAYGTDYHFVIKKKLKTIIARLKEKTGQINARAFVDSAPVLERAWAQNAGLGWIGKNANFIVPKAGSFFFISEIITDLPLEYDSPRLNDLCGACRNCIDACPTNAIVSPGIIDARKCISYLTIELRDKIPEEFIGQFKDRIFGCDICQDVCPWTRFSKPHSEPGFLPHPDLPGMKKPDWENLSEDKFREIFKNSAVKRTKYSGLMRNIKFVMPDKSDGRTS